MLPNPMTPNQVLVFDPEVCTGCNTCVDTCPGGVLVPNPESGQPPVVLYPDECWVCGCCVGDCPNPGASKLLHPLNLRMGWKRKATGETYRIGMKDPPPPNTLPAIGP